MTSHRKPYKPHTFSYGTRQIAQRRRMNLFRLKRQVREWVRLLPRGFREYDLLP